MDDFKMESSDSEMSDGDIELQEAFAAGLIKPGLNVIDKAPKTYVNNVKGLKQKLSEIKQTLPWFERLDSVNSQAPLAPELAAKMLAHEQKRENTLKNNKKLEQFKTEEDPVLNDFKREMMFHRQAQAAVLDAIPKLKAANLAIIRPDDYFAEMAKTDQHMQKIRASLMQRQQAQAQSERVKQLRSQRKEGKAIQLAGRLERQKERKEMLDQVKKVRKGASNDLSFLDGGKKKISRKSIEKRKSKDKKFGFGGKKSGMKGNTKDSAADITEYRRPGKPGARGNQSSRGNRAGQAGRKGGAKPANKRPGKNRRMQNKSKGKKK